MDFEQDREHQILKSGYRISGVGFSIYGFAMLLSSVISVFTLFMILTHMGGVGLAGLLGIQDFDFIHHSFRAWTRILATYCIFIAWQEPSWRRRSGLLFLLSMIDLGLWGVDLAIREGYLADADSHPVLRQSVASVMGWARFGLIASLVGSFAAGSGNLRLQAFSKTAQATSGMGASLWFFFFLEEIDWAHGWPLRIRPMNGLILLYLASWVMTTICLIQASYLCLVSARESSRVLREMEAEESQHNPWDDGFK